MVNDAPISACGRMMKFVYHDVVKIMRLEPRKMRYAAKGLNGRKNKISVRLALFASETTNSRRRPNSAKNFYRLI